ncbi:MAG TPA: MotA/TolQ/ExbB proton channel family protein [Armatimonadota bacterium]|nr:MotA/TolQ/ExbB proton channel family protein [Armatimonadota bacterium]HOQ28716.1 MotA/TolQ/ExbB proton channel family protein [Armatimonadota bacterium]
MTHKEGCLKTMFNLGVLSEGGPLVLVYMLPLVVYSILSVAVILERTYTLRRLRRIEEEEYPRLREGVRNGTRDEVLQDLEANPAPVAPVLRAGAERSEFGAEQVKEGIAQALALQTAGFSRYLGILATVGSTAPFIGLFGTVLGILRAFNKIAQQGFGGPSVVAGGIAEALIATAFGLGVAIPAVIAYNIFVGKVNDLTLLVGSHASDLTPYIMQRETIDAGA